MDGSCIIGALNYSNLVRLFERATSRESVIFLRKIAKRVAKVIATPISHWA